MTDLHDRRPRPPHVPAPAPFVERRVRFRRAADRLAHRETTLLARSLDILAMDVRADLRLAGLLGELARTVGARRAAVLADTQGERRVAVAGGGADEPVATELAAWLDAWAPRSRARRAAAAPAAILVVDAGVAATRATVDGASGARHFACLPIPAAGDVVLGFDFPDEQGAAELEERLPAQLARHAAVALALVTRELAAERELEALRAREGERAAFVSTVAHELRTPLTSLSGYLDLILEGRVPNAADERDFLERSRQIVDAMGDLVGDLLELSRLESGSLRLEIGPVSPAEVVSRVVAALEPIARERSIALTTSLPPRLRSATADRRRAEQVVTNLAANAVKFAPEWSTVEIAAWFDGPLALIAVRDEGRGIAADDRDRIFERFYRMTAHERVTGTGLGLPIARDLARAMGGDLGVASVPGTGSAFVLALPGAVGADGETVEAGLAAALGAEELRLEERAVLRAIGQAPRPRLVPGPPRGEAGEARGADARTDAVPGGARARLRAIEGRGGRNGESAPA